MPHSRQRANVVNAAAVARPARPTFSRLRSPPAPPSTRALQCLECGMRGGIPIRSAIGTAAAREDPHGWARG